MFLEYIAPCKGALRREGGSLDACFRKRMLDVSWSGDGSDRSGSEQYLETENMR
jgi:hypothetical protein